MIDLFDNIPALREEQTETYNCGGSCFMKAYEEADEAEYSGYIDVLRNQGYELLQSREIEGNLFSALRGRLNITLLFTPCDSFLRITVSDKGDFPALNSQECKGDCKPAFYAFESDRTIIDCGMCLLIQCPDYSFFIIDSGHYFQFNDNDRIHRFMRERTPEGQKIVVNGWLITHGHSDHISKLMDFLKYNTDDVVVEGFYENLLPADYENDEWNHEEKELSAKLEKVLDEYPAPVYKLHTGERFFVRNIAFDVLSTHEDIYPDYIEDFNDSSCVVMAEIEGTKIFIPGDAAVAEDKKLLERFSDTLRCDVVQIAHHGHTGLSAECYSRLKADTAIFPVTRIFYELEYPRHEANRVAVSLASNSFVTGDGTVVVPLPYDRSAVYALPGETFEDFEKIKRIWKYVYTEERMTELYNLFLEKGGSLDNNVIPSSPFGWIEPK